MKLWAVYQWQAAYVGLKLCENIYEDTEMNRANPVQCSSTSVATHNQEFTARIPKSRINQTESQESGRLQIQ